MNRWQPNALARLQQAALDLYGERGFEQTTVAEIARRAGLTERTFFRHLPDKPEVLFLGADAMQADIAALVAGAPGAAASIDTVASALETAADVLQENGEYTLRRQAIIEANPGLRERELLKLARLASAIAGALRQRGVSDPAASLAADAGIIVFRAAFERWVSEPGQEDFAKLIRRYLEELKTVIGGQ
jgi:AcrR family transcriptional regulator